MALVTGTRLGPYEILGPLGAGGMGEVYRARDTRLDRTVAIKILPTQFSDHPEVRQRFEREARTVSSLNHPHICVLHDIGRQDGIDYLVLEHLEGETLAARLEKGALPPEELLQWGIEVADALDKAHRHGVIHRDLKPGNIMLTKSGAKLLDFGLAKAATAPVATDLSTSPTVSKPLTAQGTIVGTFQYISPEQLEGKEADARSDIFALGAVLYEMATGKKAFEGNSQASLIAAILKENPRPISELQPMTPPALDRLARSCLAKDPDARVQSAHDVKLQLEWIRDPGGQAEASAPTGVAALDRRRGRLAWALAAILPILAVGGTYLALRPAARALPVIRALVSPPDGARFEITGDNAGPPVLSPDGTNLAYVAVDADGLSRVWVRALDNFSARPLAGTEGAIFPFWSPDGKSIGFFADAKLKRVDIAGGPALTLCEALGARGGSWSKRGVIVFAPGYLDALSQVPAAGGTPQPVTKLDPAQHTTHRWPQFLPDGEHFIYLAANHNSPQGSQAGIYFASLDGKPGALVVHTYSNALYASGYLLYMQGNTFVAQHFDASTGRLTGEPSPLRESILFDLSTWKAALSVSDTGAMVYAGGGAAKGTELLWFDRAGKPIGNSGSNVDYFSVDISPDEKRIAVEAQEGPNSDIWVYDVERGTRTRLTFDPADDTAPFWSADETQIFFASNRGDDRYRIYQKQANGSGEDRLVYGADKDVWPKGVSRDGRYLLVNVGDYKGLTRVDLWVLPLGGGQKPFPFVADRFVKSTSSFSPDGKWIAYSSNESGRTEVYVASFDGTPPSAAAGGAAGNASSASKWQVSTAGGDKPKWRGDGKELFYIGADNSVMAVDINARGKTLELGTPRLLFRTSPKPLVDSFGVSRDGKRFLVNSLGNTGTKPLSLVTDWLADVKKK